MPDLVVKQAGRVAAIRDEIRVTGEMRVMDDGGDTRVAWDKNNADETAAARATFDTLRAKRFLAYTVGPDGGKAKQVMEFDPELQSIVLSPPMAGG